MLNKKKPNLTETLLLILAIVVLGFGIHLFVDKLSDDELESVKQASEVAEDSTTGQADIVNDINDTEDVDQQLQDLEAIDLDSELDASDLEAELDALL